MPTVMKHVSHLCPMTLDMHAEAVPDDLNFDWKVWTCDTAKL